MMMSVTRGGDLSVIGFRMMNRIKTMIIMEKMIQQ